MIFVVAFLLVQFLCIVIPAFERTGWNWRYFPFLAMVFWAFIEGEWKLLSFMIPEDILGPKELNRELRSMIYWVLRTIIFVSLSGYFLELQV